MKLRISDEDKLRLKKIQDIDTDDLIEAAAELGFDAKTFWEFSFLEDVDLTISNLHGISFNGAVLKNVRLYQDQLDQIKITKPERIIHPNIVKRSSTWSNVAYDYPSAGVFNGPQGLPERQHAQRESLVENAVESNTNLTDLSLSSDGLSVAIDSNVFNGPSYERSHLSYASNLTYAHPASGRFRNWVINFIEWMTGRFKVLRIMRKLEKQKGKNDAADAILAAMGVNLIGIEQQVSNIPKNGPVVVVANQPHGLIDGIIVAALVGSIRSDYRIISRRSVLGFEAMERHLIPVAFPHEPEAIEQNLMMRKNAMDYLKKGGLVVIFPSGQVASSETFFGSAIEPEWATFTEKIIRRTGATVVPLFVPGQNSRIYQIANRLSITLRQAVLLNEFSSVSGKTFAPKVGDPITSERIAEYDRDPRGLMDYLRKTTLGLGDN